MKNMLQIISLSFFTMLLSCEKKETIIPKNSSIPLLSQVLFDSELHHEYTYNSVNLISEEKSKLHYTKHHYNTKNQLTSSDHYLDTRVYSSNASLAEAAFNREEWVNPENTDINISRLFIYNNAGQLSKSIANINIAEYSYDNNARISRQTFYHENKKSGYIDFLYDEVGNLIQKNHYYVLDSGESQLATTIEYEFDNRFNPYRAFSSLMTPGLYTNTNNITKEVYTIHFEIDESIQTPQITINTYEYNEKGYPVNKNGTIQYIYK